MFEVNEVFSLCGWAPDEGYRCHICNERKVAVRRILEVFDLIPKPKS